MAQLYYLGQNLAFRKGLKDKDNKGILLPENVAEGRTLLNGHKVKKSNSDRLIRVKSIVSSKLTYMTPDMLSIHNFPEEETNEAIGLRFMTTLTESMTQAGLSLKHTGSFVQVPTQNQLKTQTDTTGRVEVSSDGKKLIILDEAENVLETYPRSQNFDILAEEGMVNGKGSYIGTDLKVSSAGLGLDIMIKIMGAKKAMADKGVAKNDIVLGPSYSPVDGVLSYDFDNSTFKINDIEMGAIRPDTVYYFPDGAKVKKFDRISSQALDPSFYSQFPIEDAYFIFRKEFRSLMKVTEELFEVLFWCLINKNQDGSFEYLGAAKGVSNSSSFFAQLSYERAKKAISKLAAGDLKWEDDIFTRNILDYMIISAKTVDNGKG